MTFRDKSTFLSVPTLLTRRFPIFLLPPVLTSFRSPGEHQVQDSSAKPLFAHQYVTGQHFLTSVSLVVGTFLKTGKSLSFSLFPVFLVCSQDISNHQDIF